MAEQLETVFIRNTGLQPFNSVTVKFYRLSALLTNQMIMMRLGRDRFKAGCAVSKLQFQSEIGFAKQLERAVYRGLPYARITLPDNAVKFLKGMMPRQGEKDIGNPQSLPGDVHPPVAHLVQKLVLIIHHPSGAALRTFR